MAVMERLATGYGLIEGPVWSDALGLVFSDVLFGGVFAVNDAGNVQTVFEHRRGIGGMALHESGGLVVSGRNIALKPFDGGTTVTLLERDEDAGLVGFNDITTDAAGRIYAGGLGASPVFADGRKPAAGDLYLIDLDGGSRVVGRDVQLTNGLGFSPDGRTLYHSDSRRNTVFMYSVLENGDLGEKMRFAETARGVPDGLVVAEDGSVWVALAGGGHGVVVFDAEGREQRFIDTPEPMCTSVCFGGDDLRALYIVTGSDGSDSDRAGSVYVMDAGVSGVPVPPARVQVPT